MTPAAMIEQELAAAEAALQGSNDGKARVCARRFCRSRDRSVVSAALTSTMGKGCDSTSPTNSAGRVVPSFHPPGG